MKGPSSVRQPTIWLALIPLLILLILLAGSVYVFGDNASSGPSQISLLLAAAVASVVGWYVGTSWSEVEQAMVNGISLAMKACIILLAVGSLIGSWMLSGTAPAMIDLGLRFLDPGWFFVSALVICALVSATIGSSWTTAGTIGVALIGVSNVLGLSPAITAGAVISGAYFGDKMSPLSDSTNLAPAIVGADLFDHIQHMLWTTVPAFIIAAVLFVILGFGDATTAVSTDTIDATRAALQSEFNLSVAVFLPLLLLLGLAISKFPALPTIVAGALSGCIVAVLLQPDQFHNVAHTTAELAPAFTVFKVLWSVLADGYVADTGRGDLDVLLSNGGMSSMLNTVWLIIAAMSFGGVMERTGLLHTISQALLRSVRGTASLIATTVFSAIGLNVIAADQYIAIVIPGRMFKIEYQRHGLAPVNLSRTLEDAGTMTSALVPWNTCGAFMAGTLGVATFAYLPYAFLNLLSPMIAIFYGIRGICLVPLPDGHGASPDEPFTSQLGSLPAEALPEEIKR